MISQIGNSLTAPGQVNSRAFCRRTRVFLISLLFILLSVNASIAKPSDQEEEGVVSSFDLYSRGNKRGDSGVQTLSADVAMRSNDVNRAIRISRKAVELDPENMEARVSLGEALYQKVKHNKNKNPDLYNECVKTWLTVYRDLVGEESGLSYKGISFPGARAFYEDEDHGTLAKSRLIDLCGRTPRPWETNKKFLNKVLVPEEKVSGHIIGKTQSSNEDKVPEKRRKSGKVSGIMDVDPLQ